LKEEFEMRNKILLAAGLVLALAVQASRKNA